jgi:hypothetical protein
MRTTIRASFATLATAALAASAFVAPAAASTTYQVTGIETAANSTSGTFQGVSTPAGTWQATIVHGTLNKSPGGVTPITGGSFALAPFGTAPTGGTIQSGTVVAGAASGLLFCTQQFVVSGTLLEQDSSTGSFQGVLTHFGIRSGGVCNASFATFSGSVTV